MREPVVWVEPERVEPRRAAGAQAALSRLVSFGAVATVAWVAPIHTVAALAVGVVISVAAVLGAPQP